MGGEGNQGRDHGLPHGLHPSVRDAVWSAVVVERYDLGLQDLVERLGVEGILVVVVIMPVRGPELPSILSVVPLHPPPVQNGQVQGAVYGRLHPRCSAGFHWGTGVVGPYVAALHHVAGNFGLIVLEKEDVSPQFGRAGQLDYVPD